jgi:hypothetical protein
MEQKPCISQNLTGTNVFYIERCKVPVLETHDLIASWVCLSSFARSINRFTKQNLKSAKLYVLGGGGDDIASITTAGLVKNLTIIEREKKREHSDETTSLISITMLKLFSDSRSS